MNTADDLAAFLRRTADTVEAWPTLRRYGSELREAADSSVGRFNLAVVGRMKTGKSTLINSLIGNVLALSDVEEATATINWIAHGTLEQSAQFVVHRKDGSCEVLPLGRLKEFSGKDDATLIRIREVAWLEFFDVAPSLKSLQIIDTPGTGSAVGAHEKVAQNFLDPTKIEDSIAEGRKADAIIYVVPPVGRESDKANLGTFDESRLPNTGPYNSLCVLHKWDALEDDDPHSNAQGKAAALFESLKEHVCSVQAVSGPIALAAQCAPEGHWMALCGEIQRLEDTQFEKWMRRDDLWDAEEVRRKLRLPYPGFPWASFVLACRQLKKHKPQDDGAARNILMDFSGIRDLHQVLEERIFSRARIIKQMNVLARSSRAIEPMIRQGMSLERELRKDLQMFHEAIKADSESAKKWISEKTNALGSDLARLKQALLEIDQEWQKLKYELGLLQMDLLLLDVIQAHPVYFPKEDHSVINSICNHLASLKQRSALGRNLPVSLVEVEKLINRYRSMTHQADANLRGWYEHCVSRFEQIYLLLSLP